MKKITGTKPIHWMCAIVIGFLFYYVYRGTESFIVDYFDMSFIDKLTNERSWSQVYFIVAIINIIFELIKSVVGSLLFGILLVFITKEKALIYSVATIISFMILNPNLRQLLEMSDTLGRTVVIISLIVPVSVFVFSVWIVLKIISSSQRNSILLKW